jgi:hypothetical protein
MSPLYLYNGSLLVKSGGLAAAQSCCCETCVYCPATLANMYSIYRGANSPVKAPTGATGSKKQYLSCAGLIQVDIFTGSIRDGIVATNAATGVVLYSSGLVRHGSSATDPWTVVFGTYTFCKPAGVRDVDITIVGETPDSGFSARVSNCLIGPC